MTGPTVVVFAKAPVAGTVKTRLARSIGTAAATDFYRSTLATTVARLRGRAGWSTVLAVTPDSSAAEDALWPGGVARIGQGDGDLGVRMRAWLDRATPDAPVLVVGSDIPEMTADHVAAGFRAIRATPGGLVFGPAQDGGFWLVGTDRPPPPGVFDTVRWSSPHALSDTLANLGAAPVALVDRLHDIDEVDDYRRFMATRGET